MKNILRISCLSLILLSTACGQQSEIIKVVDHTQTSESSVQPVPTKTPTPIPTQIPSVKERIASHGFPKLYNQYQAGWPSETQLTDMERLNLWDVITVDAESLSTIEYLLGPNGLLRSNNPNLIISVYFSAGNSEPTSEGDGGFFARFNDGLEPNWLLRDINGTLVKGFKFESGWSGYYNLTVPGIDEYFAIFLQHELIDTGLFDGIFYDWGAGSNYSWLNYQNTEMNDGDLIDLDQDGVYTKQMNRLT